MAMQMKDPERGSPLLRKPRKVTQSWFGTFERSHLVAFSGACTGRSGVSQGAGHRVSHGVLHTSNQPPQPKESTGAGSS